MESASLRVALMVDFDNIFGELAEIDRESALLFAQSPASYLSLLTRELSLDERPRRLLVQRVYMNPAGSIWFDANGVKAPRGSSLSYSDADKHYFSSFRESFVAAGFAVVDCIPVSKGLKNAADIKICVDIMAMVSNSAPIDEYVIMSGDSDLTPLIQHLRACDKSTVLATTMDATDGLSNSAERVIYVRDLVSSVEDSENAGDVGAASPFSGFGIADSAYREARRSALEAVAREILEEAIEPILLSRFGNLLREDFSELISVTNWLGFGNLKKFLFSLGVPGWTDEGHYFVKDGMQVKVEVISETTSDLPRELELQLKGIGVPLMPHRLYQALFTAMIEYIDTEVYRHSSCAVWIRDTAPLWSLDQYRGLARPSRSNINFVVRGCSNGGLSLRLAQGKSPRELGESYLKSIERNIEYTESLTPEIVSKELQKWLPDLA